MNAPFQPSRRDLLKGSSVLVVAFSLAPHLEALAQDAAATKPVSLDQVDTFLAIDDKGMVTLYTGKVDLGTGVNIGLAQIVAAGKRQALILDRLSARRQSTAKL